MHQKMRDRLYNVYADKMDEMGVAEADKWAKAQYGEKWAKLLRRNAYLLWHSRQPEN